MGDLPSDGFYKHQRNPLFRKLASISLAHSRLNKDDLSLRDTAAYLHAWRFVQFM